MPKAKCFFRAITESGSLIALAVAVALLVGIVGPAAAQFFNFGDFGGQRQQPQRGGGGWFGNDLFAPYQQQVPQRQAPRRIMEDFSKAPPPEKRETVPERNVLVLGDGMADWLALRAGGRPAPQTRMGGGG